MPAAAAAPGFFAATASPSAREQAAFVDVPASAFGDQLRGMLPDWQVDGLLEDYAHYARGEAAEVLPTVTAVTGRAPRTVAEFAREHKAAFMPS